jgi:NADPH:quinone reductase-like Zn-dependent oxidoreductase
MFTIYLYPMKALTFSVFGGPEVLQYTEWISSGKVSIPSPTIFLLKDGEAAHKLLESRKSTGKIVLIP